MYVQLILLISHHQVIHLYNHLDLRAEFNEQFVKSGIKVNEMSICEESLEEYFTKIIDKKERYGEFNA